MAKKAMDFYPDNWDALKRDVLKRSELYFEDADYFHCCEWCSKPHGEWVENAKDGGWIVYIATECFACGHENEQEFYCHGVQEDGERPRILKGYASFELKEKGTEKVSLEVVQLTQDPRNTDIEKMAALCKTCRDEYNNRPEQIDKRDKVFGELHGQLRLFV